MRPSRNSACKKHRIRLLGVRGLGVVGRTGSGASPEDCPPHPRRAARTFFWNRKTGAAQTRACRVLVKAYQSGASACLPDSARQDSNSCVPIPLLTTSGANRVIESPKLQLVTQRFRNHHAACFVQGECGGHNGIIEWYFPFINGLLIALLDFFTYKRHRAF